MSALMPMALPERRGDITLSTLVDHYCAAYQGRDSTRMPRLAFWVERMGHKRLDEISDDDVHFALDALAQAPARRFDGLDADGKRVFRSVGRPPKPATVNRYQAALSAVFTWAMKRRVTPKGFVHPCRGVELRPENNAKTRFLSEDERDRLLAACRASAWPRLYLLVLLALTTGARRGELMGLRWGQVDLVRCTAHLARTKNGDLRTLPLVPAVVDELAKFVGKPQDLVFPSKRSTQKPYAFEARWMAALDAAKITGVTFHSCRHTTASYLAQSGASLLQIGDVLGHRSVVTARRYAHLATEHRAELVNRVLGGHAMRAKPTSQEAPAIPARFRLCKERRHDAR